MTTYTYFMPIIVFVLDLEVGFSLRFSSESDGDNVRLTFDFKNAVTLKTGLGLRQGHWKYHHVIEHL